jgi:hypothetical protein
MQVLRKFLDVFSKFDWDAHALSLQGPIPLASFPDPQGATPTFLSQHTACNNSFASMLHQQIDAHVFLRVAADDCALLIA